MALNFLPIALQVAGTALQAKGASTAAKGARLEGQRKRQAKEFEAAGLETAAGQAVATAQQRSFEEQRRARLVASRAVALAAAGGGGATDPTVVKLLSDLEGEGAYRAAVQVYQGEEEARTLRQRAAGARYEGGLAEEAGAARAGAYRTAGAGALLSGGASLYAKYGVPTQSTYSDPFAGGALAGGAVR